MEEFATIDAAGRLVVPKAMRERLGLSQGSRVRLREEGHQLVVEPMLECFARPRFRSTKRPGMVTQVLV